MGLILQSVKRIHLEPPTNYSSSYNEVTSLTANSVAHTISVIVSDVNGCKDTLVQPIIVSMPRADLTYTLSGASVNALGEFTCPPVFAAFTDNSDSYGNTYGIINKDSKFKVVIEAHADEISWFVNYIDENGYLFLRRNGGSEGAGKVPAEYWLE